MVIVNTKLGIFGEATCAEVKNCFVKIEIRREEHHFLDENRSMVLAKNTYLETL